MRIRWVITKRNFWLKVSQIQWLPSDIRLLAGFRAMKCSLIAFKLSWEKRSKEKEKDYGLENDTEEM